MWKSWLSNSHPVICRICSFLKDDLHSENTRIRHSGRRSTSLQGKTCRPWSWDPPLVWDAPVDLAAANYSGQCGSQHSGGDMFSLAPKLDYHPVCSFLPSCSQEYYENASQMPCWKKMHRVYHSPGVSTQNPIKQVCSAGCGFFAMPLPYDHCASLPQ